MGEPPERAEIRGCEPVSRHTHHVLWLFAAAGPPAAGPPAVPDRKAEDPVSLISRLAPIGFVAVHRPVRGGGGMTDPGSSVLGGGGMTDADSAVLGGGGMTEHDDRAVVGGGGITDPDSAVLGGSGISEPDRAVLGGGGIAEQDESAVLGGGGITGPPSPKSRWDVSQVQLAGELSNSRSGGESGPVSSAPEPAHQAALAPISILPIVRLARRFRNRPRGANFPKATPDHATARRASVCM
jgi:hypothetical protein